MVEFKNQRTNTFAKHFACSLSILLLITLFAQQAQSATIFKIFPVAEDYFQKIYMVNHESRQYYLTVACKEKDMLSISLTEQRDFQQSPRFNIYGHNKTVIPKLGQNTYTFLKDCHAIVQVDTPNFLEVKRTKDSEPIFTLSNVTFRHLHNSFTVNDPSTKWGLGERFQQKFRVTEGRWTIWNRDKAWAIDKGATGVSDQTYGHHPLYLAREKNTNLYHLAYFKNTYGLLIQATKDADHLVYNSVGGNLHFIIILGQHDPEEVLEQYHDYIGRAHIPPFWSMGYHQCRWGYKSSAALNEVLQKFNEHDLPIDTIWSDLDYMDQKMIFTVNPFTHGGNSLNKMMEKHEVSFIPLMDVGVSTKDTIAMQSGSNLDVYLRNPRKLNEYYKGEVWPGQVHFVDFLHPQAGTFWKSQLHRLYDQVKFSGLWVDMNEASNFQGNEPTEEPFRIQQNEGINQMTINVEIPHYSPPAVGKLYHREVHAYFGHLSTVHTHEFFKEVGVRPFIISRSNSVGTGHFSGHWTGDNVATWEFLRLSISGNFLHQIFGIQMVGADICGFHLDTTEELCSRWMQLGSFYPFSRNHNEDVPRPQQPYTFGKTLLDTSRLSLKTRYALLKQLFSIMVMKQGKGSFFRPIGFQFYDDNEAFVEEYLQTQFLIGKGLMIAPIVYQNTTDRDVYFPSSKETWYSFKVDPDTGKVQPNDIKKYKGGKVEKVANPLPAAPPAFLRGGYSVMTTEPVNRATKLGNQFHLFSALKNGESSTYVLGIEDYNSQSQLSQCIQSGCPLYITLKKGEGNSFTLTWNYEGPRGIQGKISIDSILAAENDTKWIYEKEIKLTEAQGEYKFEAKQI